MNRSISFFVDFLVRHNAEMFPPLTDDEITHAAKVFVRTKCKTHHEVYALVNKEIDWSNRLNRHMELKHFGEIRTPPWKYAN